MTIEIAVNSEIGRLNAVMIHRPGAEIENMTPATAREVLYDDILTLDLAQKEHRQLSGVLRRFSQVLELQDLLQGVLENPKVKGALIRELTRLYECEELEQDLLDRPPERLAAQLLHGTPMPKNSLARYLSPLRHIIPPLPNTFFTRDATMCVHDKVIIGSMAYKARLAEALLLKAIFKYHPQIESGGFYFDGTTRPDKEVTIEGGDLLVIRDDLIVIGYSERTTAEGIDVLMRAIARQGHVDNFIVVEIPKARATIHLDMIFTMVDVDKCVVFPPLITGPHRCRAFHVKFDSGEVSRIVEYQDVLEALRTQGLDLSPISCGGSNEFHQEREQWASGANFLAFGPGQVLGYAHNGYTVEEMQKHGFEVVRAEEVITGSREIAPDQRVVVTMDGAELSRGGGGCRCMTMPLNRQPVDWSGG